MDHEDKNLGDADRDRGTVWPAWQPIETAPLNESVLIFIPNPIAEHYGPAVYRGLCVPTAKPQGRVVWKVTGLHFGSDCGANNWPTHWMPLPDPPCLSD